MTVAREQPHRGPHPSVRKAIVLAAGVGDRLRPFTDRLPKCLVPVNGVPILVNTLSHLADSGVEEAVIVVGYLKEKIFDRVGGRFQGMKITYVESERYATTNNIYSLWLAREHLNDDVLLIEADVFFEREVIDRLLRAGGDNQAVAAVAPHQPWMSGTVVQLNGDDCIEAIIGSGQQGAEFDFSDTYKTVNIYRFGGCFLQEHFLPHLDATIASGNVHGYYEMVLCDVCSQNGPALTAVRCGDLSWIEIDNQDDLAAASYQFASPEERHEYITGLHGDYWRYDFVDHSLLYNLHYPPEALLNGISNRLREVVLNYPGAQDVLARLMGTLIGQPPESIVVGNGASELIKVICGRLKRRLIVPVPSFNEWVNAAPEGLVTESSIRPPSFQLDVERFARDVVDSGADTAIVVNPNNPTSIAVPKDDLLWLVERLAERDVLVIVDESFIDFTENRRDGTMETETGRYQNLAVIKSLSKCYGIGGLRLGYLLSEDSEFTGAVREEVPIWNINGFAEMFLRLAPHYRRQFDLSCQLVRADCDRFYQRLSGIPGLTVYRPDANFVFCRLPDDAPSGPELARRLFIKHNILVKHCAGKTMPEADRYIRIASRTDEENRTLAEALADTLGQHMP